MTSQKLLATWRDESTTRITKVRATVSRSTAGPVSPLLRPCSVASSLDAGLGAALAAGGYLRFDDDECVALSADELAAAFAPDSTAAGLACLCFYREVTWQSSQCARVRAA